MSSGQGKEEDSYIEEDEGEYDEQSDAAAGDASAAGAGAGAGAGAAGSSASAANDDEMLAMLQKQVDQIEAEAAKLRMIQKQQEEKYGAGASAMGGAAADAANDVDSRSVFVGGVDFSVKEDELKAHFQSCGVIVRCTILLDKVTQHPKGYAYIEFADKDAVESALALNESLLKGRQLRVTSKRTNVPGRGRGRGRGRGMFMRGAQMIIGYMPMYRRPYRGGRGGRGGRGRFIQQQ